MGAVAVPLCLVLAWGCSGIVSGNSSNSPSPSGVSVSLNLSAASVQVGGTQQFTATVTGSSNTTVTWTATGGTITAGGFYTAPASAGTFTVMATSTADTTKKALATVTVTATPPVVSITISPTSASLQTSATQQFTATVTGTNNTSVTWLATLGSIDSNGLYTAPSVAGNDTVTASSVADPSKSALGTATVTGTSNTAVTWSATGGTITSGGLYTAPGSAGTFTVTATSVADPSKTGSATANVFLPGTWPVGWNEIPGTHLRDHTPSGCSDGYNFNSNAEFIMGQWSGGVADTTNNRLLIFGGGHNNGFDNGVYALNVGPDAAHTNMSQLVTSTCLTNWGFKSTSPAEEGLNINGSGPCSTYSSACNPNARQTYDALVYDPVHNRMIDCGGVTAWNNGNWTDFIWELDLNTLTWTRVGTYQQSNVIGMIASGWDPNTNTAWVYDEQNLNRYDPTTHTATLVRQTGTGDYHQTSIIDPVNNVFWTMGNGV